MRSKFKWIFTLLMALSMQFSFAQEKTVTGVVSDATGPLPGANIIVKGTIRSAQTDFDGKFAIKAKTGEVLVISYTGYNTSSITVGAASNYNVKLQDGIKLDEVVILGYDKTATKAKSLAASTTVSSEGIKNRPNVTVLQSLAGQAAGLNVFASSGSPGSAKFDLLIRGKGSINSSTEPLYVVDGVPTNSVVFRNINPEDITTMSVLKDAAATSIYGNRGANGVVVIKTKSGVYESGLKVSYSSSFGVSSLPNPKYDLMNSQQLLTLQRQRGVSVGAGIANPGAVLLYNYLGREEGNIDPLTDQEISRAPNQNWTDVFFTSSITQSHNLSLTSGGKNLNQFTSLSYTEQGGLMPTTDFERFTFRNNLNGKSENDKFSFGTNLTVAFSQRNQLSQETAAISNFTAQNPLLGAITGVPYFSTDPEFFYPGNGQGLFDRIGTDFEGGTSTLMLQDLLQEGNQPNLFKELKILANINAAYKLTKNLTFDTRIGVDYNFSNRAFARAPWSFLAIAVANIDGTPFGGFETRTSDIDFGFNTINSLKFNKVEGNHTFDLGVYTEYIKAYRQFNTSTQNGLDPLTYAFGAGTGWTNVGGQFPTLRPTNAAAKNLAGSFSYFAVLGYDYNDRYGIEALVRRDASYRFIEDYKWGTFWSFGGRWNINKENFMQDSWFNMLKLRASYGVQGNQNIIEPAFGANPLYTASNIVRDLTSTATGYGITSGYDLSQFGNNELRWENQSQLNIGIDFGILKDKLSGTIDVYNRHTTDLFTDVRLSSVAGAGDFLNGNRGTLQNRGIELSLKYKVVENNNFSFLVFANGSYNKNKILDINGGIPLKDPGASTIMDAGTQVNEWWYVPYAGVNPLNGNLLFFDINGDLTENPNNDTDRRNSGKSLIPIYQGGFGFNMDYKGFFMDAQFSYVFDVYKFDTMNTWINRPSFLDGSNMSTNLLNAWSPINTDSNVPSLDATNFELGEDLSNVWLRDASYVRLRNFSFGYSFDKKLLNKSFITDLKLFVQGENLYTWTKWEGFDPDSGESTNLGRFPAPKTVSFGVNVQF